MYSNLVQTFIDRIYSEHSAQKNVQTLLGKTLEILNDGSLGLDVGGQRRLHPHLRTLNLEPIHKADYIADAEAIPMPDETFALVVTQETLEHLKNPDRAMNEMYRVLKPGGLLFCQVPFIIGYHPAPGDFWRFTKEGIAALAERSGFSIEEVHLSHGPSFGFYQIAVEFVAIAGSTLMRRLYKPMKGVAALCLYPLKWLDPLLSTNPNADRIARGYIVIARKPNRI